MPDSRFLVSDIGGTNIRVASFVDDPRHREDETTYREDPATGKPFHVIDALADYCRKFPKPITAACLGVAGRVKGDHVQITNRPDLIQRTDVATTLGIDPSKVTLVNDMPPHLAAVDKLLPGELIDIKPGQLDPSGSRAVLMPGTGVGIGGAVSIPRVGHLPFPSEGGHVDFAPRDWQQERLLAFLRPMAEAAGMPNVSNEFVFAGDGIRRLHGFFLHPDRSEISDLKSEQITTAVATQNLPPDDPRRQTIDLYLKLLAAAAGNLALMFAATGGMYFGGSICLSLRKFLAQPQFLDAFYASGPPQHRPLLEEIPVKLIDYKDSGLLGAGVLAKMSAF